MPAYEGTFQCASPLTAFRFTARPGVRADLPSRPVFLRRDINRLMPLIGTDWSVEDVCFCSSKLLKSGVVLVTIPEVA